LESGGDQSVDMLTHWYEYLARKMAALLSAMELILEMDSRGTVFREEFGELEDC
jgi:hypothetical protein